MQNIAKRQGKIKANASRNTPRFSRWIRKYTESLHDPKIVTLSDRQYRDWDRLLLIAAQSPTGDLPELRAVACDLRVTIPDARNAIEGLVEIGLIDVIQSLPTTIYRPHNWDKRQFVSDANSSTVRSQKYRARKRVQRCSDVAVTLQERCSDDFASVSVSESAFVDRKKSYQESKNLSACSVTGSRDWKTDLTNINAEIGVRGVAASRKKPLQPDKPDPVLDSIDPGWELDHDLDFRGDR